MNQLTPKMLKNTPYWEMQEGRIEDDTPILLGLHWMGGDASMFAAMFADFGQPLRGIFLQAQYSSGKDSGGYSWYPDDEHFYSRSEAEQAPDIRRQIDNVAAFLRDLKSLYPAAKIAVVGMSQGGDLTLGLTAYYPELLNLAIPNAGRLSAPMRPSVFEHDKASLPHVYLKHGLEDEIVPVAKAREAVKWLSEVGYKAELHEYAGVKHTLSDEMISDMRRLVAGL